MRIDVGSNHGAYLCGASTLGLSIYSTHVAASIGRGPICLLLFLMALVFMVVGVTIIIRVFLAAESEFMRRAMAASAQRRTSNAQSESVPTASKPN